MPAARIPTTGGGDWTCRKPDHWLFAGTGMKEGEGIPGPGRMGMARRPRQDPGARDRRERKDPRARVPRVFIPPRSTPARRETLCSTRPQSGGPTAFQSRRATSARRSTRGPKAPTNASSKSPRICSTACGVYDRSAGRAGELPSSAFDRDQRARGHDVSTRARQSASPPD